tara:strand:+ start:290 stop:529 length:240 start_codon:yes stop_codon:yes gene_type:complete
MVYFLELEDRLVVVAVVERVIRKNRFQGQRIDTRAIVNRDKTAIVQVVAVVEYYLQVLSVEVLEACRVVSLAGLMQMVQ